MKKLIKPTELADNAVKLISQDWLLITAGDKDKFNTMTASWGGIGFLWNKPVAYVFIRPERYTYEFTESKEEFTLSFFANEFRPALTLLGKKSGRNGDKIAEAGLTPYFTENGNPTFEEARIVMECKKLYSTMIEEEKFIDKTIPSLWYDDAHGNYHKMYVVEITNMWIEA